MYQNLEFSYKGPWDLELAETGYTNAKLTQLKTYYMPEENLERGLDLLMDRIHRKSYGSVLIPHQGRLKKGFTKNDFCMIGTTIINYPKEDVLYWNTHWRSMECIKRGRGDFLLIRHMLDHLKDATDIKPVAEYRFKFDTLTFHTMFTPLLTPWVSWRGWLRKMRERDPQLFMEMMRWWEYYFVGEGYKNYSVAHQVRKIMERQMSEEQIAAIERYARRWSDHKSR